MYLVDSNLIIAFFRSSEDNHEKARFFISALEQFVVTDYILLEVATVLSLKEGVKVARKAIELLKYTKEIFLFRLTDEELEKTTQFFMRQKHKISFVDASLIVLAENRGLELATFDKTLSKAASEL